VAGETIISEPEDDIKEIHKIPKGQLWLEGDNSKDSLDSRLFGPVSSNMISGRVNPIVFPSWHIIEHDPDYYRVHSQEHSELITTSEDAIRALYPKRISKPSDVSNG